MRRVTLKPWFLTLAVLWSASISQAQDIYGLTAGSTSTLIRFDAATPGTVTVIGQFTGLLPGQTLQNMDFRPSNGQLYAFSKDNSSTPISQLYTVNLATAALTPVGPGQALTGSTGGTAIIDFNPVADRLRVITTSGANFRLNPDTGVFAAGTPDTNLNTTNILPGLAYSNNVAGASSTTLYGYDFNTDTVVTVGSVNGTPQSPNGGQVFTVGSSGTQAATDLIGFDISSEGVAYLTVDPNIGATSRLFTVDLGTGNATLVGDTGYILLDIAAGITPTPEPGTVLGVAAAGLGFAGWVRRRRSANAQ